MGYLLERVRVLVELGDLDHDRGAETCRSASYFVMCHALLVLSYGYANVSSCCVAYALLYCFTAYLCSAMGTVRTRDVSNLWLISWCYVACFTSAEVFSCAEVWVG